MDKLREEFEEWFSEKYPLKKPSVRKLKLWEAWRDSRASIVVELPQRQALYASGYGDGYFVPSDTGEGLEYEETVEAIRSIGLSIKGE